MWVGQSIMNGPYEDEEDAEEEADDARGAFFPGEEAHGAGDADDEDQPGQEEEVAWAGVCGI